LGEVHILSAFGNEMDMNINMEMPLESFIGKKQNTMHF